MSASDLVNGLKKGPLFSDLLARVDKTISPLIARYRRDMPLARAGVKAIKDAVWGMIDVQPEECVVLDSPPLQRLRRVRQLGVTYLTFPTAGYSRFEHTLGAMHQAERMLRAIATRSPDSGAVLSHIQVVRLAALLHDVGHLPLSHVAERFYGVEECPDSKLTRELKRLSREVGTALGVPLPGLAECLSLAVALSPSFHDLLVNSARYSPRTVAEAAVAIVGRPPSAASAFVAQIITNVIDADKLDYMFRDAFLTRVPLAVDLERLLYKIRCLSISSDRLPKSLMGVCGAEETARVLGTDLAGERLAYDLAISRTMLYERVYLHHKTRAAERVVLRTLVGICQHPAELLAHDDGLFTEYGRASVPALDERLIRMLVHRQLPRRVYGLSYGFLAKQAVSETGGRPVTLDSVKDCWTQLSDDLKSYDSRAALEKVIAELTARLACILGEDRPAVQVWIDTPPRSFELNALDLLIERPDETIHAGESFPANAAAFAQSPNAIFFVYVAEGDETDRERAFIAAELVLADRYKLQFGRVAADHAKMDLRRLESRKRDLEAREEGLYDRFGSLRPQSHLARTARLAERIRKLADRFHSFNIDDPNVHINIPRINAFLDQFPERLVEPMLSVLEQIRFLDRETLGRVFSAHLKEGSSAKTLFVPLTSRLQKSAAHVCYFLSDHAAGPKPVPLEEALKHEGDITFFDESTFSGKQSSTVVQTWFGLPLDLPNEDDLAPSLSAEDRENLQKRGVRFRFLYGLNSGLDYLKRVAKSVGLNEDVVAFSVAGGWTHSLDRLSEQEEFSPLRAFLSRVGHDLLLSTKHVESPEKWTTTRCQERALGYGNLEQLVVFAYNTPTATLTALWKGGRFRNREWLPLFPRRGERSSLVERMD